MVKEEKVMLSNVGCVPLPSYGAENIPPDQM